MRGRDSGDWEATEPIGVLISTRGNQLLAHPCWLRVDFTDLVFEGQLVLQLIDEDNNSLATGVP